jgi:hypothetical protein
MNYQIFVILFLSQNLIGQIKDRFDTEDTTSITKKSDINLCLKKRICDKTFDIGLTEFYLSDLPFNDTFMIKHTQNIYFLIYLSSCLGKLECWKYNNNEIVFESSYDGIESSKIIDFKFFDPLNGKTIAEPKTVFRLKNSGIWNFYENKKLKKWQHWDHGILLKESTARRPTSKQK